MNFNFRLDECFKGSDDRYNYTYIIVNTKKNKLYGGVSFSKHHPSIRRYKGTSLDENFWLDYKDHSESFYMVILHYYSTKILANEAEKNLITVKECNSSMWYNKVPGGNGRGMTNIARESIESKFGKLGRQFSTPQGIINRVETQRRNKVGCFRPGHLDKARWINANWWDRYDLQGNWIMSHKGQLGMSDLGFDITRCKRNKDPYHVWVERNKTNFEDELNKKLLSSKILEYENGILTAAFTSAKGISSDTGLSKLDYIKSKSNNKFVFN